MELYTLEWKKEYNTGIASVDKQHQNLFNLIKSLANAYLLKKEKQIITSILFELEDYTQYHFQEEEHLFLKRKDVINDDHLKEHRAFEKKIHDLKFEYVSDNKLISIELLDYLRDWLQDHILETDKQDLKFIFNS